MIDQRLINYMQEELKRTPLEFHRYMYDKILWHDRLVGLVGLRGVGKSTILMFALISEDPNIGTQRETFFFNQMRVNNDVMTSKVGDFRIKDYVFEVGGKNKGREQISKEKDGIVVKDEIEFGQKGFIPLWQFGLNY